MIFVGYCHSGYVFDTIPSGMAKPICMRTAAPELAPTALANPSHHASNSASFPSPGCPLGLLSEGPRPSHWRMDQIARRAHRTGPSPAASVAVMAGAPMRSAYTIHNFMSMALAMEAEKICVARGSVR